jgi:hypothetical protein
MPFLYKSGAGWYIKSGSMINETIKMRSIAGYLIRFILVASMLALFAVVPAQIA